MHARGDVPGAARAYAALDRESPRNAAVLHPMGVALAQLGRMAEAEAHLLKAAELAPRDPDVLFDMAALRDAQGKPGEAEKAMRRLVEVAPQRADAWAAIGMYRRDINDFPAAAEAYQGAFRAAPDKLDYALQAAELMPPEDAAALLIECLERFPGNEAVLLPLAEIFLRLDQMEEAEALLKTLEQRNKSPLVSRHLGAVYFRMRRFPDAAAALYDSIGRDPRDAHAWNLLSQVRDSLGDADGAVAAADRAVSLEPDNLNVIGTRARLQQHANRLEQARAALDALPAPVRATADVRYLQGMLMPPILDSNEEIDRRRERWMETMADVEAKPTFVSHPWETVAVSGFYLGYHGREDRPLMEAFRRASLATSPHLRYTAPHLGGDGGKLRVGFLSAYMRQHSVGRVLIKLMGGLDRSRFDVTLFQLPDKRNGGQEFGEAAADRTVRLVRQLEADRALIEAERLDVLIYCDFHLNAYTDALAHSRLAPVQATTWGHPGTSGHETIDYWVSCEDWEPEGSERLYTERLVRLKNAPFVYTPPVAPDAFRTRKTFGLRDDVRLYGCLQSLMKMHPDYDSYLAKILAGDPKGRIVLIEGPHYTWREALVARFARSFDPSRVDFLPPVPNRDYMSAVAACDIMLDPIHFAGANTTLEAFAVGKPVVTLRGDQMRNRETGGFYRQLGYERPIAKDEAEYVDIALRLAGDRKFYAEAREAILANNHVLYDNLTPVAEFESWLESVRK